MAAAQVYAKLSGAHSKAVTALVPIGGETPGSADMLVSASADGSVAGAPFHALNLLTKQCMLLQGCPRLDLNDNERREHP